MSFVSFAKLVMLLAVLVPLGFGGYAAAQLGWAGWYIWLTLALLCIPGFYGMRRTWRALDRAGQKTHRPPQSPTA